jgi:hypothetical protein
VREKAVTPPDLVERRVRIDAKNLVIIDHCAKILTAGPPQPIETAFILPMHSLQ